MANDECFRIVEESLALQVRDQVILFNKQIKAISHRAAATGASGAAIREVIDICANILRSRVEYIITTLGTLPFEYSYDLKTKISGISLKYFPSDFGDLSHGIDEIIRIGLHSRELVYNEITKANEIEIERLRNELDKYFLNFKIKQETQPIELEKWAGGNHVTVAILFTDIVGSTALRQKLGDELMERARQAYFDHALEIMHKYRGWEIKTIGDSFMLAFRNVADALDFAIDLQSNTGHPDIKIRVGIHIGPIQIIKNDAFGSTIDFASRIVNSFEVTEVRMSDRAKRI